MNMRFATALTAAARRHHPAAVAAAAAAVSSCSAAALLYVISDDGDSRSGSAGAVRLLSLPSPPTLLSLTQPSRRPPVPPVRRGRSHHHHHLLDPGATAEIKTATMAGFSPLLQILRGPQPAYCTSLRYRPSNNIPESRVSRGSPDEVAAERARASAERAREASLTIDEIEDEGFIVESLMGEGSFGCVYSARVKADAGWREAGDNAPAFLPCGSRVAIKRMAKGQRFRPVDVDEYGHGVEEEEAVGSPSSSPRSPSYSNHGESAADRSYAREMKALRAVGLHPNTCSLLGTFETESAFYIVLELIEGLPLFDWIVENGVFFRESTASNCLRPIVEALAHMHARHVCHNDIKPENIIVGLPSSRLTRTGGNNPDEDVGRSVVPVLGVLGGGANRSVISGVVEGGGTAAAVNPTEVFNESTPLMLKIIDFGMAHVLTAAQDYRVVGGPGEGTFAYWAPEMMEGEMYGTPADMWALGVTMYIALCGTHPFDPEGQSTDREIFNSVLRGAYATNGRIWSQHLSADAKECLHALLEVDPAKRITAEAALRLPFFTRHNNSTTAGAKVGVQIGEADDGGGGPAASEQEKAEIAVMRRTLIRKTSQRLQEIASRRKKNGAKGGDEGGGGGWFSFFS